MKEYKISVVKNEIQSQKVGDKKQYKKTKVEKFTIDALNYKTENNRLKFYNESGILIYDFPAMNTYITDTKEK